LDKAGNSIAARMAMIAMTTNNSINVKAGQEFLERERPAKRQILQEKLLIKNNYRTAPKNL
jgi:hypothetical protein